jgi:hypothetical protein
MNTKRLTTKGQKEIVAYLKEIKATSPETAWEPPGADVTICLNLEKKGFLKSTQKYPEGHPWRTGESWGYEVRQYYLVKND